MYIKTDSLKSETYTLTNICSNIEGIYDDLKNIKTDIDFEIKYRKHVDELFNTCLKQLAGMAYQIDVYIKFIDDSIYLYDNVENQLSSLASQFKEVSPVSQIESTKRYLRRMGSNYSNEDDVNDNRKLKQEELKFRKEEFKYIVKILDQIPKLKEKLLNGTPYSNQYLISQIQEHINNKGIDINITGKLNSDTYIALEILGINNVDLEWNEEVFKKNIVDTNNINNNIYNYIVFRNRYDKNNISDDSSMYFSRPPHPDSNANAIDRQAEIYSFCYLYECFNKSQYYEGPSLMEGSILYRKCRTDITYDFLSVVESCKLAYDIKQIKDYAGIRDFLFSKYAEQTSSGQNIKNANAFLEWTGIAAHPSALLVGVIIEEIKDPLNDKRNIQNRFFEAAINDNPFNLFLLDGYKNKFLKQKDNMFDEINNFKNSNMSSNDEEYFHYKVSEIICDVFDMNDGYNRNKSNLDKLYENVKKQYYEEKKLKEEKEFEEFKRKYPMLFPYEENQTI